MPTGQISNKTVKMPNGTKVEAGKKYGLRQPANTADSIPTLKTTLVSNSKLADAGYTSVFDKDEVNVYDNNTTEIKITGAAVMTGFRDKTTGLWRVPLKSNPTNLNTDTRLLSRQESNSIVEEIAANVHDLPSTEKVIRYLHAAAGFPTKPTWIKAITSGFYSTWPLLTVKNVNKHFPESEETQKGHMRQKRSGVRKTNRKIRFVMNGDEQELEDIDESIRTLQAKKNDIKVKIYNCSESVYTDQTGRFPIMSRRHHKYIMVLCEIDGNQILMEPMVDRKDHHIVAAFKRLLDRLKRQGIYPKHQYLDNEASELYKRAIQDANMTYQLATPHMHRANIAERAIQTAKNHFKRRFLQE